MRTRPVFAQTVTIVRNIKVVVLVTNATPVEIVAQVRKLIKVSRATAVTIVTTVIFATS